MVKKPKIDDTVVEVMNRLVSAPLIVYDAETTGLSWLHNAVVGHVLTFGPRPDDSYYLPVRHGGGGNVGGAPGLASPTAWDGSLHPLEPELMRLMNRRDLTIVGHNLAFDTRFVYRLGHELEGKYQDTMLNAPLLDEFSPKFSLEYLAEQAGVEAKKSAEIQAHICARFPDVPPGSKGAMGHFWRFAGDDPVAVAYAAGDGTSTWQLRAKQIRMIETQELQKVWGVENRLIPVLARMMVRGVRVDEERLHATIATVGERLDALLSGFPEGFGAWDKESIRKWMEVSGRMDWPTTPKKKEPSFTQAWLEQSEPGRKVVALRKLTHLRDTFLLPLRDRHLHHGRVYTTFNQLRGDEYGTVTGRLSSSDPNMQQIHKRDEEFGRIMRACFIPDDGMLWGSADWRQMEPVLLAYYSRCKVLLDGYRATPQVDAHTAVTRAITPGWEKLTSSQFKFARDRGKRVNQTLITGGGKGVLHTKYGIPVDEVEVLWRDYFRAMPEIREIQKKAAHRMRTRGYVLSLLGRRARLRRHDLDYQALNRLLQCGNADAMKYKLVQIDDMLRDRGRPGVHMLLNVHDAIEFQFDPAERAIYDEALRIMCDFSEGQLIALDVPLGVDANEGPDWSVATYGDEK